MGNVLGHNQRIASVQDKNLTAYSEAPRTIQYRDHCVAASGMGRDFLPLVKGENRHTDMIVLHQRLTDYLALLVLNLSLSFNTVCLSIFLYMMMPPII